MNDYEGISGYEEFLDDLTLMYFASVGLVSGDLVSLEMVPLQIRRFQLAPASDEDTEWLLWMLDRECRRFRRSHEPQARRQADALLAGL